MGRGGQQTPSARLLYGTPTSRQQRADSPERPDTGAEPTTATSSGRAWGRGDIACWRPDRRWGWIDVLIRHVDKECATAEIQVLTPHVAETNQAMIAPLSELEVKGGAGQVMRADFKVGDEVVWSNGNALIKCRVASVPDPHADWVSVDVGPNGAGLRQSRYKPHRSAIRLAGT